MRRSPHPGPPTTDCRPSTTSWTWTRSIAPSRPGLACTCSAIRTIPSAAPIEPAELETLAAKCLEHDLVICSDEIHCDLLLGETEHIPIASIDPEIARNTITLMAPSKTYNMPGLACSFAIITNPDLRSQFQRASAGIVPHVNVLGYVAAQAAYVQCADWEHQLLAYLTANRDFLLEYLREQSAAIAATIPEATYLGWLDFNRL